MDQKLPPPLLASPPQSDPIALPNGHGGRFSPRQERTYHNRKDGGLGGPLTLFASTNDQLPLVLATTLQPQLQDRHTQERSVGRNGRGGGVFQVRGFGPTRSRHR